MCSPSILQIVYDIFFDLSLDYSLILYTEFKAAVAKKCQEVAKGRHLPSLLFPRFLGLLLPPALDDNNIDVGRLPPHKVNVLTQYRPTMHKEGYEAKRPIPKRLMSYMKSKEIRRAYRHTRETLEPVSRTPVHIGVAEEEERSKDTSMPQAEGKTVRVGEERMRAKEERVRVLQEREKERKQEEARKKKSERVKKKKAEAERAEEERAEKARQAEIARLREEARLIAEEEARQTLAQSSSPNQGDDQEHYDDAARSYTSEGSEEEDEENDEEESEGDEEESEEVEEEEEGGGKAVALPQGGTEQPRPNKHIRFTYPTTTTLQQVVTSLQRVEASTSINNQALIPLSVPVDYVTHSAMNALGDKLLQNVADLTADYNSKAITAAKNINDTLARFNYRSDDEVRRVAIAVDELLKTIEEVIKSMSRAEAE
ncbi:uncharacterized protein KIAA1211 homolog [Cynara cardunculus var. scolymus]|uniref:uncharacterized protein KIAA1211 homolog n=1 Tax=Cynara cardunculus var. scolymus TaxID=59895 RepID=UPI000D6255A0|nr:uncharacterized protein KIAA1211 homolog [Cynara cardunculus var. scolymus]